MKKINFTNWSHIFRFLLKRERKYLLIWIISLSLISAAVALNFEIMFKDPAELVAAVEMHRAPSIVFMTGPLYGGDLPTLGAIFAHEMSLFTMIAVVLMNIFLVLRHTRGDEELGRIELTNATPLGRYSSLTATFVLVVVANITLALVMSLFLFAGSSSWASFLSTFNYSLAIGASGIIFATITACLAQLTANSRTALMYVLSLLLIIYFVRGIGDVSLEALSLITPLGLLQRTSPYVSNHFWPIIIVIVVSAGLALLTYYLYSKRDYGQGLLQPRRGARGASRLSQNPFGLMVKIHAGKIIIWLVSMLVFAVAYGSISGQMEEFIASNEFLKAIFEGQAGSPSEIFHSFIITILLMIAVVPVATIFTRFSLEERNGNSSLVLIEGVSRWRLYLINVLIAVAFSALIIFITMLGLWVSSAATGSDSGIAYFLKSGFLYLPAFFVIIGLSALLHALNPRLSSVIWVYLGISFLIFYLTSMLPFPEWLAKANPFEYTPKIPVEEVNWVNLTVLTLIGAGIISLAGWRFRWRDLAA